MSGMHCIILPQKWELFLVFVWPRYTGAVSISWENKLRLITDQAHIPHSLLCPAEGHNSPPILTHMVIPVSMRVSVRPAEVQGRQHLTKLLRFDYVSYFTAKLRTAVWMSLWEKKTKTWYLTHFVWGEFRQVCCQQCEEWFGAVRSRCWQTTLNAEQTFWIHAVQAWLGSAGRLSTGCPAGCVVSAFSRGW